MKFKIVKPQTEAQRTTQTTLDTIEVTPDLVKSWKIPKFQRELRVNDKVQLLAQQIQECDGVIPGVVTIGVFEGDRYLIDGQHRREAFLLSGCILGYVDVRILHFNTMAEMGEEYVNLNSRLVVMRPDDIMRGLEDSYETLKKLKRRCPFVGYDNIRRGTSSPVVSMSALLRCWSASACETPSSGAMSAAKRAELLSMDEVDHLIAFLNIAIGAWGRDLQYGRLWSNLNLSLCMWIYRRVVTGEIGLSNYARSHRLTPEQFGKCLMSLSADGSYVDWLHGRNAASRDMSPCYGRIKSIFARRIEEETGRKPLFPAPAWSVSK